MSVKVRPSTALDLLLKNYLPQDYHIKIIRRGSRMAVISTARCIAASGEQIVLYKINVNMKPHK